MWEAELAFARARAGDTDGATRILSGLIKRARHEYVSPYDLAIAFVGIRDHARRSINWSWRLPNA
jgi:hypothetical protein